MTSFEKWFYGETDVLNHAMDEAREPDSPDHARKERVKARLAEIRETEQYRERVENSRKEFRGLYLAVTAVGAIALIGVLLYVTACLPEYGAENPHTLEVITRYIEKGLEETGAVNIVSGIILDYRAFDTLGESHVLFTALICSMLLLRLDRKNMRSDHEDYYTVRTDKFFDLSADQIFRRVGAFLVPSIFIFGIYVVLNGQVSPGGGFSGGAILGAGLILFSASFGFEKVDRIFTRKVSSIITLCSLGFYSFAKGYVFFTGANGIENHIPKGTPGNILSGGMILPLDIAVGLVVGCTMFGFYSLFRRGSIGGNGAATGKSSK
ncbi:MAG: hypothetical protein K5637_05245 [Lachnospiraceae bacterium]|nr:hypothetical protein [Lachnospiraceae bacterium]